MPGYGASPTELLAELGGRARALRLLRSLRQEELALRAGVSVDTVRRFEKTGAASMDSAIRIASALNADAGFRALFEAPKYRSIDEALARPTKRSRAPRKK